MPFSSPLHVLVFLLLLGCSLGLAWRVGRWLYLEFIDPWYAIARMSRPPEPRPQGDRRPAGVWREVREDGTFLPAGGVPGGGHASRLAATQAWYTRMRYLPPSMRHPPRVVWCPVREGDPEPREPGDEWLFDTAFLGGMVSTGSQISSN